MVSPQVRLSGENCHEINYLISGEENGQHGYRLTFAIAYLRVRRTG